MGEANLLQGVEAGSWTWKAQWNVRSGDVRDGKKENIPSRGNCAESHGLGHSGTFKARSAIPGRRGFAVEYGDRLSAGQRA